MNGWMDGWSQLVGGWMMSFDGWLVCGWTPGQMDGF